MEEALDRPYAYVVVTTKAVPEIQKTPQLLAPLLVTTYPHPQPIYVLMQNGVNIEVDLYQALEASSSPHVPRIISTSVWAIANMLEDCTVQHYNIVSPSSALIGAEFAIQVLRIASHLVYTAKRSSITIPQKRDAFSMDSATCYVPAGAT